MPPAKYILTANHEEDPEMKKAMEEKEKELQDAKAKIAKLEATHNTKPVVPGDDPRGLHSLFKAILSAMDDDEHEMHKGMKGMDYDDKETAKKAIKAMMEVFEEGNGTQVENKTEFTGNHEEDKEHVAKTAALLARIKDLEKDKSQVFINKILTAKTLRGATEDDIKLDSKRLAKMSLKAVTAEYESSKIFIEDALTANEEDTTSLTARTEQGFEFNGEKMSGLYGNTVSIDKVLEKMSA